MRTPSRPAVLACVSAAVSALLLISACGGSSSEPAAEPAPSETSLAAQHESAPEPVEPTPEPEPVPPEPVEEPPPPEPVPPEPVEEPPAPEPEPAPPEPAAAEETFDSPAGITCTSREPDPPPNPPSFEEPFPLSLVDGTTYTAVLDTSCGTIVLELDTANAPITSNNFIELARAGYYDGLTFHRAVPGFVIQGGDPLGNGTGGPGYQFEDELPTDGYELGDLAMANAGPNTNGSQFFIVTGDASFLSNDFSKFGKVTEGLEVAIAIESLGDPATQQLTDPVYVYSVTINES